MRAMRAGWLGKGWEVCGTQGKMKETKNREVSFPRNDNFIEAQWKGFGRKEGGGGWVRDEEAQTSFERSLRKKR